jgi:hypothetical protein
MQRSPRLEIEARREAIKYAWLAKDTVSAIIFTGNLSNPYHMLNNLDSSLFYSQQAASLFRSVGRKEMAARTLGLDIEIYLRQKHYTLAKQAMEEYERNSLFFDQQGNIDKGRESYYNYKGIYYEGIGKFDSATYYYRKLLLGNANLNEREAAYKGLLSIYQKLNNGDSIAKYSELYCQTNDSASFTHSADEITRMQALYNYNESERRAKQEEIKADNYRKLILIIILLVAFCGYFTYRFIRHLKISRREELIKANTAYTAILEKYYQAHNDLQSAQFGLNNYRALKEQEISFLQHELSAYQEEEQQQKRWDDEHAMLYGAIVQHLHKIASRAQKASAMEWQDLNRFALDKLPSFVNKICDESLNLSDKELMVCILTRLHFIPTEIAALFDLSKQRISNIRAKANRKLFNNEDTHSFDSNIHKL